MIQRRKHTVPLILVLSAVVVLSVLIGQTDYNRKNAAVDPRIVKARELYSVYNNLTQENKLDSVFILLDSIESIYASLEHYKDGFEIGVLENNRAAAWLTIALFSEVRDSTEKDSMIVLADSAVRKSISCYIDWKERFGHLSREKIYSIIADSFTRDMAEFSPDELEKFIDNRIDEIIESQVEIDRRMSVSMTNLGIIYRYHSMYDSAAASYQKALQLWDRNLSAENNLNLLLGLPQKKRNIIQKLFPPNRI